MALAQQVKFGGSGRSQPPSWREGLFSNWTVVLGDRRFRLHKFNLARASAFLEGAMAEAYESSESDLTEVLPKPCWPYVEDLFDAIYAEGKDLPNVRSTQDKDGDEDGVLSKQNVVHLLAAADTLGVQVLFERAITFLDRRMCFCGLAFWRACLSFEGPLSPPLEKVAAVAREAVLKGFERYLTTEMDTLLCLPYYALVGLLREDMLAVRAELILAEFVFLYGKTHKLVSDTPLEVSKKEEVDCPVKSRKWRDLCAALRWTQIEVDSQVCDCPFSWQQSDGDSSFLPRLDMGKLSVEWGRFPSEFFMVGMVHNRMQCVSKSSHAELMQQKVPCGLVLRGRNPVRPDHAPPLLPYQVEKFVYFAPGNWERGRIIVSNMVDSGLLRFRLRLFPGGDLEFDIPQGTWAVSAFVDLVPQVHWPETWEFKDVQYSIKCVPWQGNGQLEFKKQDTFTFKSAGAYNRGWKWFLTSAEVGSQLNELLSPEGYLLIRAEVVPASALQGP